VGKVVTDLAYSIYLIYMSISGIFIFHEYISFCMPEDDYGMDGNSVQVPDYPGPNVLGHTPLLGSVRRSNDLPVIRDEVADAIDENVTDLPDKPKIEALNTK
jgi:hypothetical protein